MREAQTSLQRLFSLCLLSFGQKRMFDVKIIFIKTFRNFRAIVREDMKLSWPPNGIKSAWAICLVSAELKSSVSEAKSVVIIRVSVIGASKMTRRS
jgi:hypothetical protein